MTEAAAVVASKGLWGNPNLILFNQSKKPTSLDVYLREKKIRANIIRSLCRYRILLLPYKEGTNKPVHDHVIMAATLCWLKS